MFKKILIANRGEIACRIIRTARRMGITTIAIYSTADAESLHVSLADQAFCVGAPPAAASYLAIEAIIKIAKENQVEAIHPGYGFLSENPQFALACEQANIVFIGPSVSAMEAMASKQLAKQRLEKTQVPLTPGYHGSEQSDERLLTEAKKLGFPILLKAASGGGGKGMREVQNAADFQEALTSARREAKASFADDTMLIEKLIHCPRHIEMQIMADNHGEVVHLFERDCSIQRRHQKIIEEAPAINLSAELREKLANAAIEVARAIDYHGAGTIEFLVDKQEAFYFMEMNTRLQVEHPVTEMITELDLVEWQIRIAANEPLPLTQKQIHATGHAIECRIYAEDPQNNFMPSIGQLHFLQEPKSEYIRIETGVICGSTITMYYDPMIAKLIAWGETREEARLRLVQALEHYYIGGVKTNLSFLKAILTQSAFVNAQLSTHFLNQEIIEIPAPNITFALHVTAAIDYLKLATKPEPLWHDTFAWQMHLTSQWQAQYIIQGKTYSVLVTPISSTQVKLQIVGLENQATQYTMQHIHNKLHLDNGHEIQQVYFEQMASKTIVYSALTPIEIAPFEWQNTTHQTSASANQLTAPMPGTVVAILKKKGDAIQTGEPLMVLEAMKMEHTIRAPSDGVISQIFYNLGSQVSEGATLAALETT